jgi:hypothetical protein
MTDETDETLGWALVASCIDGSVTSPFAVCVRESDAQDLAKKYNDNLMTDHKHIDHYMVIEAE